MERRNLSTQRVNVKDEGGTTTMEAVSVIRKAEVDHVTPMTRNVIPRKEFYPEGIQSRAISLATSYGRGLYNYVNYAVKDKKPTKYVDRRLREAIEEVLQSSSKAEIYEEFKKGLNDDRITKVFTDVKALYDMVDMFRTRSPKSCTWRRTYQSARKLLIEKVLGKITRLQPLSLDDAAENINSIFSNMNASAGAIAYGYKKQDKIEEIITIAKYLLEHPHDPGIPALCFTRAQISNYIINGKVDPSNIKYKTRLVWCVDAATVLLESRFARPLMNGPFLRIQQYAGGKSDDKIQDMLLHWKNGKYYVCIDYSNYDSSVPAWLILDMFEIVKLYFDEKYHKEIDQVCRYFIHTKIIMPDGSVKEKHKGIPSGSYFTQIIGSLVNLQMVLTYFVARHGVQGTLEELADHEGWGPLMLMAMGDDNVMFTRTKVDKKDLSTYLYKMFGVQSNEAKFDQGEYRSDNPKFLKREWTYDGQVRNILELLLNAVHPERKRSYKGYTPWHILYGYFITYEGTMKLIFDKKLILEKMNQEGGIIKLLDVKPSDLPGSLRVRVLHNRDGWKRHVQELQQLYPAA